MQQCLCGCKMAGQVLRQLVVKKGEKLKETPDLTIDKQKYKSDLIPPRLIVECYFGEQQQVIDKLQAELDGAIQELEALVEEHGGGEDGFLAEAQTDGGKVTKATVAGRLKELKGAKDAQAELTVLKQCAKFIDREAELKRAVKDAVAALDLLVFDQYPKLSAEEVRDLVVEAKWLWTLEAAIRSEVERVTQQLANRVRTLEERYAEPLPLLVQEVEALSGKVDEHLKKMGLVW
jgi:type I restriction enzyme M protein